MSDPGTQPGTQRLYRPDPMHTWAVECWGRADVRAEMVTDTLVVTVHGDVDATNGHHLADYVERHAALASSLVLDTRGVDFFGTAGVAALSRIHFRLRAGECRWSLVAGAAVRKALRVCRVVDLPQTSASTRLLRPQEADCRDLRAILT